MSKDDDNDDYDPHFHRLVEHPITNCEALINLLKAILGNGVLALPLAFRHVGWLNGVISALLIGAIITYAKHILIKGMYELCKRERTAYLTYPKTVAVALKEGPPCLHWLSSAGELFINFLLAFYHFGTCGVYVVFVADNIKEVGDVHLYEIDIRIYIISLTLPLILIYFIRNLKHLVPFSCVANCLLIAGYGVVLYYVLSALPPFGTIKPVQDLAYYPLFFGTLLFATEAIALAVVIEGDMKHPKDFLGLTGVLNKGMAIIVSLNAAFGFLGYWRYGDDIEASISLNLPDNEILPDIIKIMFAIAIYLSYPLQGYITIDVIWNQHLSKQIAVEKRRSLEYVVRVLTVLGTVICAAVCPNMGLFLSLVGSFCYSLLGIIIPASVNLCVKYKDGYGFMKVHLLQDSFLILFGIVGCVMGTFVSVNEMVKEYQGLNASRALNN